MTRIAVITAALLGTSMLAGAADGRDIGRTGLCKSLERKMERLCRIDDASCDRIEAGYQAICGGVGTIYASPAAESVALDLLRSDYEVVTVAENFPARFLAAPVVVTGADLDDPTFTTLLNLARDTGRTVAIVDATREEADRFARFFGARDGANCLPTIGSATIELYGLQESLVRRPPLSSSYCLAGLSGLDRAGEGTVRRWLRERFALSAPQPTAPEPSDSDNMIVDLATAVHCSSLDTNDPAGLGRILTQDVYVTGARSFINSEDVYYVQNELQYTQGSSSDPNYAFLATRFGATGVVDFADGLSQTQPATVTAFEDSFTNTTSETISESVGFQADGPTGTIGTSVTHGQSVSYSIPATTILNNSANPLPAWEFQRQNTAGTDFTPQTSWFWTVPWDAYADGGAGSTGRLEFTSQLEMRGEGELGDFVAEFACAVPYPFEGILDVGQPTITSVSPTTVQRGQKFTITGSDLYPGLVNAILLGGTSVSDTNFTANGETSPGSGVFTVDVIVPGTQNAGTNTVVAQQTFNNQARFSNDEVTVDVRREDD